MSVSPTLGQRVGDAARRFFGGLPPPDPATFRQRVGPARGGRGRGRALAAVDLPPRRAIGPASAPVASSNDPASIGSLVKALAGGRTTTDTPGTWSNMTGYWLPPSSPEEQWGRLRLDEGAITDYPPYKLLELLADLSPDISRAMYDTTRMLVGEWSVACFQPGTTTPDERALASVRATIDRLTERHGSFEVLLARQFTNAYMRGAFFAELVLDQAGRQAIDIAMPDPISARFKLVADPTTGGMKWQLGQLQQGSFVELDRPTVRYIPLDPLPGTPYGRSPLAPALFPALFFLALLHDIRRVVSQQGYPRLDIAIDFDAMLATMPPEAAGDVSLMAQWAQQHIDDVVAVYSKLPPDAAYVHASTITLNKPVGAVDAQSLGGINGLIAALERLLVRALKTMPLLMGISDGVSEANANRQWEIQLTALRHPQRLLATILERFFTLALRAEGIQATVDFTFRENRKSEEARDEQTTQLKLQNAITAFKAGFFDQDEASQYAVGHDAAEVVKREDVAAPAGGPGAANATTPGGNKEGTPPKGSDGKGKDAASRVVPLPRHASREEWEAYWGTEEREDAAD